MTRLPCPLGHAANCYAHQIAVHSPTESKSYAQLDRDVAAIERQLAKRGVLSGHRVAIQAPNSYRLICTLWALFRLRAIACLMNPRWPAGAVQNAVDLVRADHVLSESSLFTHGASSGGSESPSTVDDEVFATIVFSSGSTGEPKAIAHDLKAHLASAEGSNQNLPLQPGDRWLLSLPLCHVAGYGVMFRCVTSGATIALPRPEVSLAQTVAEDRITHVSVVPRQLQQLCAELESPPATLRAVLLGGSSWSTRQLHNWLQRGWSVFTTYGLSEMASQVTTSAQVLSGESIDNSGSLLSGRELKIASSGEVLVRGETLFRGYVRHDELSLPLDAEGWFHTRDRGQLDPDGCLRVLGRLDSLFISGGENIYPEEIEHWLLELLDVERAIVVNVPDEKYGQRPVAFVESVTYQPDQWREVLGRVLPKFKIPDRFLRWPSNHMDGLKPDRRRLAQLAVELIAAER